MPAMLDDPNAPLIYRTSGEMPFPTSGAPPPSSIVPRVVTLRDRVTIATIVPFFSPNQVPIPLLGYLCDQLGREIVKGDTYPMLEPLTLEAFGPYWFGVFGAVMVLGDVSDIEQIQHMAHSGVDWSRQCLGSFYIKSNYPGRSSHVCTGGFQTTDAARNRGVGRLMGETYLEWAPKLGYTYSVFNLVYETNVASCRIWDALGFKRIGRVKGCGALKSYPNELIDAIIYGRDLGQDDDFVSEERFDKIRYYLKNAKYPNGADRAEKSRLRSAATHYKLLPATPTEPEKLVLKGKEVIADPQRQYEIARTIHHNNHGGINKTTAAIAESFHWVRIKETVSQVIRNCPECSEMNKGLTHMRVQRSMPQPPLVPQAPGPNMHPIPVPPPRYQRREATRSPSPSDQLQMEAAQHEAQHEAQHQHTPVDPALMDGIEYPTMNLHDLPPSPFLTAGRNLPMPQPPTFDTLESPALASPALATPAPTPNPVNQTAAQAESPTAERTSTASQKIRTRLTRAGYPNNNR
ncbi:hypothetical protein EJ04DRAFT_541455 [Polyplosphaeria fusca]|uniref:N-acetyltransferase domain-containing protein n=1 Tax=Polyplosphaeria fusca TaxID=682080 RepID=A0A9P4R7B7_9PLEO|nr:hypothetical protein EJ04DRAFT_541455 [Polyplosphaeria fusca]